MKKLLMFFLLFTTMVYAGNEEPLLKVNPLFYQAQSEQLPKELRGIISVKQDVRRVNRILESVIKLVELPYGGDLRVEAINAILQKVVNIHHIYPLGSQVRIQAFDELEKNANVILIVYTQAQKQLKHQMDDRSLRCKMPVFEVNSLSPYVLKTIREYFVERDQILAYGFQVGLAILGVGASAGPVMGVIKNSFGRRYFSVGGLHQINMVDIGGPSLALSCWSGPVLQGKATYCCNGCGFACGVGAERSLTYTNNSFDVGHVTSLLCASIRYDVITDGKATAVKVAPIAKTDYKYFRHNLGIYYPGEP